MDVYDEPLDGMSLFARDVRAMAPLDDEEVATLLMMAGNGDDAARNRLVEGMQPFVLAIAKRLVGRCAFLDLLDLAQEGSLGLMQAIQAQHKYPAAMPFSQFAFYCVRSTILQAIYRHERAIRIPAHMLCRLRKLAAVQANLFGTLGREATREELANKLALSEEDTISLLLLQSECVTSLDVPASGESDLMLADIVPAPSVVDNSASSTLSGEVGQAINRLSPRERQVVMLRYGFGTEDSYTTRQIAEILGIPQRMVQDIDRRVRMRLRIILQGLQAPQASPAA